MACTKCRERRLNKRQRRLERRRKLVENESKVNIGSVKKGYA